MKTKSTPRAELFASATSQHLRIPATLRLQVAREEQQLREMGARIADLRAASGYTQQHIADKVGVDKRTYQTWQEGRHKPSQDALERLAELFAVTPRYILRGEDLPTPNLSLVSTDPVIERLKDLEEQIAELSGKLDFLGAEQADRAAAILKRIDESEATIRQALRRRTA